MKLEICGSRLARVIDDVSIWMQVAPAGEAGIVVSEELYQFEIGL